MSQAVIKSFTLNQWSSGGSKSFSLPQLPISLIQVVHNTGSLSGGASGSYIANTAIASISVRKDGLEMYRWDGDKDTDKVPNGINALRELNRMKEKGDPTAEVHDVNFPDAVSPKNRLELVVEWNVIGNINDGDRTGYTGTYDVNIGVDDIAPGILKYGYVSFTKYNMSNRTGMETFYIPGIPKGYKLHGILMKSEDNATPSNTTFDNIKISVGTKTLEDRKFARIQDKAKAKFGIAHNTGWALWTPKRPFHVEPSMVQLGIEAGTAGTDKELHIWLIAVR